MLIFKIYLFWVLTLLSFQQQAEILSWFLYVGWFLWVKSEKLYDFWTIMF